MGGAWVSEWSGQGRLGSQLALNANRVPDLCGPWFPRRERGLVCTVVDLPALCQESQLRNVGVDGRLRGHILYKVLKKLHVPKALGSVSTLLPSSPIKQVLKGHTRGAISDFGHDS